MICDACFQLNAEKSHICPGAPCISEFSDLNSARTYYLSRECADCVPGTKTPSIALYCSELHHPAYKVPWPVGAALLLILVALCVIFWLFPSTLFIQTTLSFCVVLYALFSAPKTRFACAQIVFLAWLTPQLTLSCLRFVSGIETPETLSIIAVLYLIVLLLVLLWHPMSRLLSGNSIEILPTVIMPVVSLWSAIPKILHWVLSRTGHSTLFFYPAWEYLPLVDHIRYAIGGASFASFIIIAWAREFNKGLPEPEGKRGLTENFWAHLALIWSEIIILLDELRPLVSDITRRFFFEMLIPLSLSFAVSFCVERESTYLFGYIHGRTSHDRLLVFYAGAACLTSFFLLKYWVFALFLTTKEKPWPPLLNRKIAELWSRGISADLQRFGFYLVTSIILGDLITAIVKSYLFMTGNTSLQSVLSGFGFYFYLSSGLVVFSLVWHFIRKSIGHGEYRLLLAQIGKVLLLLSILFLTKYFWLRQHQETLTSSDAASKSQTPTITVGTQTVGSPKIDTTVIADFSENLALKGHSDYHPYRFFVPPNATTVQVTGKFSLEGAETNQALRLYVMKRTSFIAYQMHQRFSGAIYDSGRAAEGKIDVGLPAGGGDYVLVVFNNGDVDIRRAHIEARLSYLSLERR